MLSNVAITGYRDTVISGVVTATFRRHPYSQETTQMDSTTFEYVTEAVHVWTTRLETAPQTPCWCRMDRTYQPIALASLLQLGIFPNVTVLGLGQETEFSGVPTTEVAQPIQV